MRHMTPRTVKASAMVIRCAGRSLKNLTTSLYLKLASSRRSSHRASPKKSRLSSEVSLESWMSFSFN